MPEQAPVETAVDMAFLDKYQQAWSAHDADAIVAMMTPDCLYEASFGSEPWGERFVGRKAVSDGIKRNLSTSPHPNTELVHYERHIFGSRAFSMWTSTYVEGDGSRVSLHGCDYYEFKDGLVSKKIAFRKAKGQ